MMRDDFRVCYTLGEWFQGFAAGEIATRDSELASRAPARPTTSRVVVHCGDREAKAHVIHGLGMLNLCFELHFT